MRLVLAAITGVFTLMIAILTVLDMVHNGVNWLDVLALGVVLLFATGILGALLTPPDER
jgi:hypothetical protein